MRDAVAVQGNRSGQDDEEHDHVREKRTHAYIKVPELKFFECCSSPLRKRTLTSRLLLFNLFTRLPEKQIRTDRGAENRHQRRPLISRVWHRRDEGRARHSAPVRSHHKRGYGVGEEHQHEPLEHIRYLVIMESDRGPRNQYCKNHYKQVRIDPRQHLRRIRHASEVRSDINRIGRKQRRDNPEQQPTWKSPLEVRSQALSRHLANAGTHHLNRSHQRPGQERGPEQLGSKLCARNGICGNAGWVIVGSPSDDARSKRLQQRSHPSRWGKCRHERVGPCILPPNRSESAHNPTRRVLQIERSKWSNVIQCDQTSPFATSMMLCSEEVRRP